MWEDYAEGRFRDLMAQRLDAYGSPLWTPAEGVVVIGEVHDQYDARLALDASDNAYIVFTDDRESNGGEDTRLGAYAQILTPAGQRVGAENGIELVDRLSGHCVPRDVITSDSAAYVLIEAMEGGQLGLILQKLNSNGTVAWPEDPALIPPDAEAGYGMMVGVEGGLAVAWMDHRNDLYGDIRLLLADYERNTLPGWPAPGLIVAEGTTIQLPATMSVAPDGDVVLAWGDAELNPDLANLRISRYGVDGVEVHAGVDFGIAAMLTSPVDLAWDGDDLVVAWTERNEFVSETIRTQKLSSMGQKLWRADGNAIWTRTDKVLRVDLVKPEAAPARLFLLSGRTISQPESLLTCALTTDGLPASGVETLSGGITYDIFDPRVAEIGYERAMLVWTDSRGTTGRDVYVQILNGQGQSLLEPDGRKLTNSELNLAAPPAITADGQGGAFIAWVGDSAGTVHYLNIRRVGMNGDLLWAAPARLSSGQGFQPEIVLIPDNLGGVYTVYSDFSPQFVLRAHVAHVTANGLLDWSPAARDFVGAPNTDMLLGDAEGDGQNGLFVAITSGPWTDTDVTLFHLSLDGTPGANWTWEGRTYGDDGVNEQRPQLMSLSDGAVLTYARENTDESATYSVRGLQVNANGETPWGSNPRSLVAEGMRVTQYELTPDNLGGFFITWEDVREIERVQVRINRFDGNGFSLWNLDGQPVSTEICQQEYPSVSPDGSGGVWIAWEDHRAADEWGEIDLFTQHLNANGAPATINGFTWPAEGYPMVDLPTYQQEVILMPWVAGSAMAIWVDRRSSNPGRCCGAGAVGDIFTNVYAQVLSEISLAVDEDFIPHPSSFTLSAYPNPFNPTTQLTYALPHAVEIRLSVVNLLGQEVAELVTGKQDAGTHTIAWDASPLSSGLYFARLEAAGVSTTKKMMLLK